MRNIDKIKNLEKEIGKYRKKVADQDKLLRKLRDELEQAHAGAIQLQAAADGLAAAMALHYGTTIKDEESGKEIGMRLTIPLFSLREMREKYEVHARRDEAENTYVLGVIPREPVKT